MNLIMWMDDIETVCMHGPRTELSLPQALPFLPSLWLPRSSPQPFIQGDDSKAAIMRRRCTSFSFLDCRETEGKQNEFRMCFHGGA